MLSVGRVVGAGASTVRGARIRPLAAAVTATLALVVLAPTVAGAHSPKSSKPSSTSVSLKSGTLTLNLTPVAWAALTKTTTGVFADTRTVTAVAPGAVSTSGVATFPISGGKLNLKTLAGKVSSTGGLDFSSVSNLILGGTDTTEFGLTTFALHFGSSSIPFPDLTDTYVGVTSSPNEPFATLGTTKAKHSVHGNTVKVTGVTLKLTEAGEETLNGQDDVFTTGQVIGTASVTATK